MDQHEAGKRSAQRRRELEQLGLTALEAYEIKPKRCLFCGEALPFEKRHGKFCNKTCSATYNNRGVTRHGSRSEFCSNCGKLKEHRQNKYCPDCIAKHVYNPQIRQLALEELKSDKSRRQWLIEERGYRCEECGLSEWRAKPLALELHHMDGDTDNNTVENLKLLCPNCHSQTRTFRRRNVAKNGRRQEIRRKRYAEGKTW